MEWVIIGQILIQFDISVLKCVCFFFDYKASIFFINWFTGNFFEILGRRGGGVKKKKISEIDQSIKK